MIRRVDRFWLSGSRPSGRPRDTHRRRGRSRGHSGLLLFFRGRDRVRIRRSWISRSGLRRHRRAVLVRKNGRRHLGTGAGHRWRRRGIGPGGLGHGDGGQTQSSPSSPFRPPFLFENPARQQAPSTGAILPPYIDFKDNTPTALQRSSTSPSPEIHEKEKPNKPAPRTTPRKPTASNREPFMYQQPSLRAMVWLAYPKNPTRLSYSHRRISAPSATEPNSLAPSNVPSQGSPSSSQNRLIRTRTPETIQNIQG
ncbi:hypothetical protein QBC47DRAFT_54727 [Echria macrotheca]|uniref:Uncharacterized protein n=1 Tax=Echria macrotheca TaxID=438768 RepID=A0AAJ0F4E0_9PEZI|nr:hypothetical protein QBC47DRAFT_54727 [Echria macrotheca]